MARHRTTVRLGLASAVDPHGSTSSFLAIYRFSRLEFLSPVTRNEQQWWVLVWGRTAMMDSYGFARWLNSAAVYLSDDELQFAQINFFVNGVNSRLDQDNQKKFLVGIKIVSFNFARWICWWRFGLGSELVNQRTIQKFWRRNKGELLNSNRGFQIIFLNLNLRFRFLFSGLNSVFKIRAFQFNVC